MKKIYLLAALLMGALAFTACSDDDDDNGGGGNGGGASSKVSRIVETYMEYDADTVSYMDADTTYFTYYADGKLKSMNEIAFTYETGKIIITDTEEDEVSTIKLNTGSNAESMRTERQNNGQVTHYDSVVYNYSGNYLQTVKSFGFYRSVNSFIQNNKDVETYTVSGGDITKIESVNERYGDTYRSVSAFGYTSGAANNANIDLFGYVFGDDVMLLGVTGKRTAKLPTSFSYSEGTETPEATTVSYDVKNGRVMKATMKNADGEIESILEVSYE